MAEKKEPYWEKVKITPQMAREWLSVGPERPMRSISQNNVAKILHAIATGEWRTTHQGMALDETGFVLDGRHRLTAIAAQRKHVECWVLFNADPANFPVTDVGKARSPGDVLHIAGETDVTVLSGVVRQVLAYPEVVGTNATLGSAMGAITHADLPLALANPELGPAIRGAIRPGLVMARELGWPGRRGSAAALIAMIALYSKHGPDAQAEFHQRVGDGISLGATSPLRAYRNWIMSRDGFAKVSGTWKQTTFLALGIRAWNDYANGRERKAIRFREGIDHMPEVD